MITLNSNLTIRDILTKRPMPVSGSIEDLKNLTEDYTLCIGGPGGNQLHQVTTVQIDEQYKQIILL